ncbi:MAG: DUF1570 domain-containing protein [Phycisphaerae bacterium]|nr:DUF1570 domain-containing protein [Phycisphaerae bacterium]
MRSRDLHVLLCVLVVALCGLLTASFAVAMQSAPTAKAPSKQAVGNWWDRTQPGKGRKPPKSQYYTVRSDLPAEEAQKWAKHLDIMYEEFTRRLVQGGGLRRRTPEVLNVMIFAREQDYLSTLRTQFGLNAMGSGGMFFVTPRGGGLAFFTENLPNQRIAHVAQHEGFHQFAHAFFGNDLPLWLNEGLAEFFGECVVEGNTVIIGQASPQVLEVVRQAAAEGKHLPFLVLLQMDDELWNMMVRTGNAALQYQQSWSIVHFLVYGDNGKYQAAFQRMLQMVNAGTRPFTALRNAFGLATDADVRDFEAKWLEHAKAAKPSSYVSARARLEFLSEGLRFVWGRGQRPQTVADLRKAMVDADFSYPVTTHGYVMTLKASDEANFAVPLDPANTKAIALELAPSPAPRTSAGKTLEAEHPTPPIVRTRGLQPKEVRSLWTRRKDSPGEWDYEIVSN